MGGFSGGFLAVVPVVDLPCDDGGASDAGIVSEGGLHDPKWSGRGRERLFPSMCVKSNGNYVYTVQGNVVTLGTNLSYASNHNDGTGGWTRKFGKNKTKSVTVLTPKRPLTRFGDPFIAKLRDRLGKTASAMGGKVGITDAQYAANFKLNGGRIGLK